MELSRSMVGWNDRAKHLATEARMYAYLYGARAVDPVHWLAAAVAVAPECSSITGQITRDMILRELERMSPAQELDPLEGRPRRLTPQARKAIDRAIAIAVKAGREVACHDIWAGLLADPEGMAWMVLANLGIDPPQPETGH